MFLYLTRRYIKYTFPCLTPDMFNHGNLYFIKASQTFVGQVFDLESNNGERVEGRKIEVISYVY